MDALIYLIREGKTFGPYNQAQINEYLREQRILLSDLAQIVGIPEALSLQEAMERCGWPLPPAANALQSIRRIGYDFILPWKEIKERKWLNEKNFLVLTTIGLLPLLFLAIAELALFIYVGIALYASILWGGVFHLLFHTPQVSIKTCLKCYFGTIIVSGVLLFIHVLGLLNWAENMCEIPSFQAIFLGNLLAAGLPEELTKLCVILIYAYKHRGTIYPRTLVLYGLFSGLGFGITEGILYQMVFNKSLEIDQNYLFNILRLTSLPFLHATWCGIASYFISFAVIFPKYRFGLWFLALGLPALLHAAYNSLGLLGFVPAFLSTLLLTLYLANSRKLAQRLYD